MKPRRRIWSGVRPGQALENDGFVDLVCLWTLRYVVHVQARRSPHSFGWIPAVGPVLAHVGIDADFEDHAAHPAKLMPKVRRHLEQMELHPPVPSGTLVQNVGLMAEILDLDATSREVLLFACLASLQRSPPSTTIRRVFRPSAPVES